MASFPIQNAPYAFDMNDFWAAVDVGDGLAKSCRYGVIINPPAGLRPGSGLSGTLQSNNFITRDLMYLCEATEFPGRGFENLEIRYYGPTFKIPHRTEYSDISMTFICRNGSYEREFFDDWMELINPTTTYNFNFRDQYATTIRLFQYRDWGEEHDPIYAFTLFDAFPILVNPQPVTWADDNFLRLTINFTYFNWRREYKDQNSFVPFVTITGTTPETITPTTPATSFTSGAATQDPTISGLSTSGQSTTDQQDAFAPGLW